MAESPDLLSAIADHLEGCHGCHTLILYGSRAAGTHGSESDYDLLGIRDAKGEIHDVRLWSGARLDIFVHDDNIMKVEVDAGLLRIRNGVILRDPRGLAADLIARVREAYDRGPKPLAPDDAASLRAWGSKMIERVRGGEGDNVVANYRRVSFLTELLENYFQIRSRWYLGPKESFVWLRANDPDALAAFDEALRPGAPVERIEELVDVVMNAAVER